MEITISGEDRRRLQLVEKLAKELGLKTESMQEVGEKSQKEKGEELYLLMKGMAASGGIKSIKDPVAWQREQRKDRPLPGREED